MDLKKKYGQTSITLRIVAAIATAAETSVTDQALTRLSQALSWLGRGSFPAQVVRLDWGAQRWLAHSRMAQMAARLGQGLNTLGLAGAKRLQTAWRASWVGRWASRCESGQTGAAPFGAGLLLGLALGMVVWGRFLGTLTGRRLAAAAVLVPLGGLMLLRPCNWQQWASGSRLLQWAGWLLNLGAGAE